MTEAAERLTFKKAVYASLVAHLAVFLLILISPKLPQPSRKGMVHYIPLNLVAPGGGGGGGGSGQPASKPAAAPAKKETLRDLTTPQKVKTETESSLRYPVEKPKKEPKAKVEKKAAITKPEPAPPESAKKEEAAGGIYGEAGGEGTGIGTGLRIGGGPGGEGFGPGFGLSGFPYTYYLNIITERVSANWFTSLVDPGLAGSYQTIIYFRIQKNGQVTNLEVEQSSGLTPLDLSALRAVRASAPFPPLPRDYEEAYLAIHLIFEHSR
ncbi:MAG: TonB C-terminal domain-containing protein [Candidatus Aminicenantes bacterium]|nr:TonB C-terminal domain-containing protein [Candidatus Aminicenantes bacterium]